MKSQKWQVTRSDPQTDKVKEEHRGAEAAGKANKAMQKEGFSGEVPQGAATRAVCMCSALNGG